MENLCTFCKKRQSTHLLVNAKDIGYKIISIEQKAADDLYHWTWGICTDCAAINTNLDERISFVTQCGELLQKAKPHLLRCNFVYGQDIYTKYPEYERYIPIDEYVIVTCDNGTTYKICIECNSLAAIATDIFERMMHK